jgi:hypothetical protein
MKSEGNVKRRRPKGRQVSFWTSEAKARRYKRAAKRDGFSSRSKFLEAAADKAEKGE